MKKKISALLLSLALCAGLLAGCGAGETEEAPSDTCLLYTSCYQ